MWNSNHMASNHVVRKCKDWRGNRILRLWVSQWRDQNNRCSISESQVNTQIIHIQEIKYTREYGLDISIQIR